MSTTQPIRDKGQLKKFKDFYQGQQYGVRNSTMIAIGLNTALRISDILSLTYKDVYTGSGEPHSHIVVREHKTGKENRIYLNKTLRRALAAYRKVLIGTRMYQKGNPYLFPSTRKEGAPLSRYQAYRIISRAADGTGMEDHISCHSLRKTFGYHAWRQGTDPLLIMLLLNHSSIRITMRYLCIEQDDKDAVYRRIQF